MEENKKKKKRIVYSEDIMMRDYDADRVERRKDMAGTGVRNRTVSGVTLEAEKEGSLIEKLRLVGYPAPEDADAAVRADTAETVRLREELDRIIEKEVETLERRDGKQGRR